jgi:hypothetical protein
MITDGRDAMAGYRKGTVLILVGTRKGAFIFSSDGKRKNWKLNGPYFAGNTVHHLTFDGRDGGTLYSATSSWWFAPDVQRSRDAGRTWQGSREGLCYEKDSGLSLKCVWNIMPGRKSEPGVVYAGVDPAGLFRSEDGGESWHEVTAINRHPTREKWTPGAGGLILHSIVPDAGAPQRMHVGISAAGVFRTEDGGASWQPRNQGTRADFLPDNYPEVGQCVHKLKAAARPGWLYQQNHCGVYRTEDYGDTWVDISKGVPSRFGFALGVHPRDPKTLWVLSMISPEQRYCPKGCLAVYRSTTAGRTWTKQGKGLPSRNAYVLVLREAMSTDSLDPVGVYFGTQNGQVFGTRNEGNTWQVLADSLPPVLAVSAAVV